MKLTLKQQAIIKERYQRGDGLNMHEMLRCHPAIVKKTFKGKACLGWRRTLELLGIDIFNIVHEHAAYVECKICGLEFRSLGGHLGAKHETNVIEYLKEFGKEVATESEECRIRRSKMVQFKDVKHWEPIWSQYYVLDYILAIYHTGYPVNFRSVFDEMDGIYYQAKKHYNSWDETIIAAGLDEQRLIGDRENWDKKSVITAIKKMVAYRKRTGDYTISPGLEGAIKRYFGGTPQALKASRIKPEDYFKYNIKKLSAEDIENIRILEKYLGIKRIDKMKEIMGNYRERVVSQYGSYYNLAIKNNIDSSALSTKIYRTIKDVHHDLDSIEERGLPLTAENILEYSATLYGVILNKAWGSERVVKKARAIRYAKYDLKRGLLKDFIAYWRYIVRLDRYGAAERLGMKYENYNILERGEKAPSEAITRTLQGEFDGAGLDYQIKATGIQSIKIQKDSKM